MSRITKEEIEKTKCGRFLLSDENIYLSIYSLNSYVFEYNLLNTEDRILYHRLQDKFDARLINRVITRVRKQIIELLDEDKYIEAKVYFKPKKLSENGELEFRPLHSTDLITQIAIVSMLHLFVYEIPEEEEGDPKLRLSNLSRLIPSDFYGNRISVKPEYLFKPWKQQYQKYNQNGSKHLYFYTLHNQEHAIVLIQNIVKLIHAIDFLKISAIDYYILFLACYLHDISMVKIPALDSFLTDTNEADELAQELLDEFNKELQKDNLEEKVTENEIKENQNLYEDELDILSVKKYMLESYKKLDEYFEKKIRRRHAIDSSSEIRQRAEIKYLDMPMRELVAEVSEAHGADERNIYSIKSNASSRLMSIKFDKILLRLADLLDMSSYRVSKPILYHNMEQMSEESAFHWISHLLTQGYKLRTKYEIGSSKSSGTDNLKETEESLENIEGVLTPQTITEKLILEIPVDISQMSTIECENPCRKVQIGNISRQEITLICGEGCQNKSNDGLENRCNFLCRWFCVKNDYLIKELVALKEYLNRNKNNYFKCEIEIKIKCNNKTSIEARQFEILNHYI